MEQMKLKSYLWDLLESIRAVSPHEINHFDGPKYIRIATKDSSDNTCVYCFVRKADGAILKPKGWKTPDPKRVLGYVNNYNPDMLCKTGINPFKSMSN